MRLSRLLVMTTALAGAVFTGACATSATVTQQADARRLRVLERSFHSFVATPLERVADVERATATLERLRLEYLDALAKTHEERERLLALTRLAELHLDLSARIRRVPYPGELNVDDRGSFDRGLSARALPLEATGLSLLRQVLERGEATAVDNRAVKRARLYLRLHTAEALTPEDLDVLQRELVAVSWRAPRSLLDTGRIGQRAARR